MNELLLTSFHTEEKVFKTAYVTLIRVAAFFSAVFGTLILLYPWSNKSKFDFIKLLQGREKFMDFFFFHHANLLCMSLRELSSTVAQVGLALKIKAVSCFIFKQKWKCSFFWINLWVTYLNYRLLCTLVRII